jgi:peptidoglycan/LPS O-acetylase OafA/YrhL
LDEIAARRAQAKKSDPHRLSKPAREGQFFGALESLRGVAALLVAAYHAAWIHPLYTVGVVRNGYLMVDFFFVLSGFVICHSYGRRISGGSSMIRFILLRLGRLYPLHLATLLFFVVLEFARLLKSQYTGHVGIHPAFSENNGLAFALNLLLLQSVGILKTGTFNAPSWSICVEFWTYLVFASVCVIVGAGRRRIIIACILIMAAFATLMLFGQYSLSIDNRYALARCVLGFFSGVLTYEFFLARASWIAGLSRRPRILAASQFAIVGVIILFLSASLQRTMTDYWALPIFAATVLLFATQARTPLSHFLNRRVPAHLGKTSYSIYMVHFGAMTIVLNILLIAVHKRTLTFDKELAPDMGPWIGLAVLAFYLVIVVWISGYTYRWIEAPLRDRTKSWVSRRFGRMATPLPEPGLP